MQLNGILSVNIVTSEALVYVSVQSVYCSSLISPVAPSWKIQLWNIDGGTLTPWFLLPRKRFDSIECASFEPWA
eukprot:IDg16577t1